MVTSMYFQYFQQRAGAEIPGPEGVVSGGKDEEVVRLGRCTRGDTGELHHVGR